MSAETVLRDFEGLLAKVHELLGSRVRVRIQTDDLVAAAVYGVLLAGPPAPGGEVVLVLGDDEFVDPDDDDLRGLRGLVTLDPVRFQYAVPHDDGGLHAYFNGALAVVVSGADDEALW